MIVKELPLEFIGNSLETGNSVYGDLIHCGKLVYIKVNDVEEIYDTKLDLWKNCIEVDPKSVVMVMI